MNNKHLLFAAGLFLLPMLSAAQSWTAQQSNTGRDLEEIFFADSLTGWAFGETDGGETGNNIRHTTDQGMNWNSQNIGQENAEINGSFFFNTTDGFVVGRHSPGHDESLIAKTQNGGQSWQVNTSFFEEELTDIFFIDQVNGWICGSEGFLALTGNGGNTWTKVSTPTDRDLYGVYFSSSQNGVAVGDDGTVLHSTDGGNTWNKVGSSTSRDLAAVSFSSLDHGWAVGDNGKIIATTDGGQSWFSQNSGTGNDLADVDFVSDSSGWAVGDGGKVVRTTDGGQSWSNQASGTGRDIRSIFMINDSCGWFCGDDGIIFVYKPAPAPQLSADFSFSANLCQGDSILFTDISLGNPVSWLWDFGDGSGVSNLQHPNYAYSSPGNYTVTLVITDGSGTQDSVSQVISVLPPAPLAAFSASDSTICLGTPVAFNDLSGNTAQVWQWDFGDNTGTSVLQNPTYIYQQDGLFTVRLIAAGSGTCTDTATLNILVSDPVVSISPGAAVVCNAGDAVALIASGADIYSWFPGTGLNTTSGDSVIATPSTSTNYLVTGLDSIGCPGSAQVSVTVDSTLTPTAVFQLPSAFLCGPGAIQVNNQSLLANSFQWTIQGGQPGITTAINPAISFNNPGNYSIELIAVGCSTNDTLIQSFDVFPGVVADFSMSLDTVDLQIADTVQFTDNSQNAITWFWDFGNGITSSAQNPTASFPVSGNYTITLTATNGPCSDISSQSLVVLDSVVMGMQMSPFLVLVYPNPVAYQAQIDISSVNPGTYIYTLLDLQGNIVEQTSINQGNGFQIQNPGLPPGIYIYQITNHLGQTVAGKLVFE